MGEQTSLEKGSPLEVGRVGAKAFEGHSSRLSTLICSRPAKSRPSNLGRPFVPLKRRLERFLPAVQNSRSIFSMLFGLAVGIQVGE